MIKCKRIVVVLLCIIMVVSCLSGCGKAVETPVITVTPTPTVESMLTQAP